MSLTIKGLYSNHYGRLTVSKSKIKLEQNQGAEPQLDFGGHDFVLLFFSSFAKFLNLIVFYRKYCCLGGSIRMLPFGREDGPVAPSPL